MGCGRGSAIAGVALCQRMVVVVVGGRLTPRVPPQPGRGILLDIQNLMAYGVDRRSWC